MLASAAADAFEASGCHRRLLMYVHTVVTRVLLLKLVILCIMEVFNNEFVYNELNSHDPPPPAPGSELSRKRKQACEVAAHLRSVASPNGGKRIWKFAKRTRTESSDGLDSSKASCLHGRIVKTALCQDQKQLGDIGRKHHIDARLAAWKSKVWSRPRSSETETLSENERRYNTFTERPWRFLYHEKGEWVEYPEEVNRVAWESLRAGSPRAEFSFQGRVYLLNFLEMMQVNLQTGYMRSIAWIDDAREVSLPPNPCEGPLLQSSVEHLDTQWVGTWVNQHRASWRDGATDSMANCLLRSNGTPGCDMQYMESRVSLDANLATDAVDAEYEASYVTANVSSDSGVGECTSEVSNGVDCVSDQYLRGTREQTELAPLLGDKLITLKEGDKEFADVKSKFLGGLAKFGPDTIITGIHRDASPRGQARLEAFERQQELTKQARGNANVRYAWHGTSKMGVSGIFLHGFGQPRTPKNGSAYGVGVYLAPESHAHVSAVYADNDENGEQHVVLCQVILGASELVKPGSEQFHPSSEHFDTGVDDLLAPKRLIVWSTHMNTHILPLYVVSFKLPCRWHQMMAAFHGKQRGVSKFCHEVPVRRFYTASQTYQRADALHEEVEGRSLRRHGPTSACISFPNLFSLLQPLMAPDKLHLLKKYYLAFKAGNFPREKLIQEFRDVVGDHRLVHAIKLLQGYQVSKEQDLMKYGSPISLSAMNASFAGSLLNV